MVEHNTYTLFELFAFRTSFPGGRHIPLTGAAEVVDLRAFIRESRGDYEGRGLGQTRFELEDGDDIFIGGFGANLVNGGKGQDILRGGRGDDFLRSEGHGNLIKGGAGDDTLAILDGSGRLKGGLGDDYLSGTERLEDLGRLSKLTGGQGADLFGASGVVKDYDALEGDEIALIPGAYAVEQVGQDVHISLTQDSSDTHANADGIVMKIRQSSVDDLVFSEAFPGVELDFI